MCGRFVLFSPIMTIAKEFHVDQYSLDIKPSYNIAPSQNILIIRNEGKTIITRCRWGFLPSWAKDRSIAYKMINARSETVAEKPAFRAAFKKQRCLIAADGFYEWKKEGKAKIPFFIKLKSDKPFGFAGLFNVWTSPEGEDISTCTIITTEANTLLAKIHDRMPVILPGKNHDLWLDPDIHESKELLPLLKPYPSKELEFRQVSSLVNSPAHNSPELIEPGTIHE